LQGYTHTQSSPIGLHTPKYPCRFTHSKRRLQGYIHKIAIYGYTHQNTPAGLYTPKYPCRTIHTQNIPAELHTKYPCRATHLKKFYMVIHTN